MFSLGFPGGSGGKESACNAGDLGSIPGLGKYPGEGKGYPLLYSGLENAWTVTWQAPLSMKFSRKATGVGSHSFPSPEDLPNPGLEPRSPAL